MRLATLTTSMGRRHHLQATIPSVLAELEPQDHYLLCDWSCPQDSGGWAHSLGEERVLVHYRPGERYFHKTAALNLLLARAIALGVEYIAALDADTVVRPGWRAALAERLSQERFLIAPLGSGPQPGRGLTGFLAVCPRTLSQAGGWAEEFRGYGCEDYELRLRLLLRGLDWAELPPGLLKPLDHGSHERGRHYRTTLRRSFATNWGVMRRRVAELDARPLDAIPGARRMLNLTERA